MPRLSSADRLLNLNACWRRSTDPRPGRQHTKSFYILSWATFIPHISSQSIIFDLIRKHLGSKNNKQSTHDEPAMRQHQGCVDINQDENLELQTWLPKLGLLQTSQVECLLCEKQEWEHSWKTLDTFLQASTHTTSQINQRPPTARRHSSLSDKCLHARSCDEF